MKNGFWFLLLLLLVSALIGSAVGEIISVLLGPQSSFYPFFSAAAAPSFGPAEFDLILIGITFGIRINLNLMALVGMIVATIGYLRSS